MFQLNRRHFLEIGTAAGLVSLAHRMLAMQNTAQPDIPNPDLIQYMKRYDVPGLSLCFRRGKTLLYASGLGESDRSAQTPVTSDTLFRIASNSKAFTSTAIFQLIEAGKLQLDSPVFSPDGVLSQYSNLGKQKDWLHSITIHQLLTHTEGGWSNESDDPMMEQPTFDHQKLIEWTLNTHPLTDPPGTKYAYSNFGYCLLGRVIEQVSGQPYAQYVRQHILRLIGSTDMRIATHKPAPGEATYYGQGGQDPYNVPITRMDSHGAWIGTARDMTNLLACLYAPQDQTGMQPLLTSESLKLMTTGPTVSPYYACGLAVNHAGNAWHFGSLPGTMSLMVHTHTGYSWAVVMNTRSTDKSQASDLDKLLWKIARSRNEWEV